MTPHQTRRSGLLWPRIAVGIPPEEQQLHQETCADAPQDAAKRSAAKLSPFKEGDKSLECASEGQHIQTETRQSRSTDLV
ncbi:unnamed protein product [Echinostoma caproni]|uniref:Uncharacterized protein n=1 Tax=Echinostoma caproni TaxID=27848 RepID=A0A183A8P9_9TREM|nr:unnamed protein product [Echinostoma caproni]